MINNSTRFLRLRDFLKQHWLILSIMLLMFIPRFVMMDSLGLTYSLQSDDAAYVQSGITFAKTGVISMWTPYPSAQIMPGTPLFFALLYILFGDGVAFYLAIKLLYFAMASFTAWFVYKSVTLYAPKWCGLIAVLPLFRTDFVWMSNTTLTETPYLLAFTAAVYFSMKYAKERKNRDFYLFIAAYMIGLMFRANIVTFPLFLFVYLIFLKFNLRELLKKFCILLCVLLIFVIPWSIRNYIHFDAFIPLTYGSGHPLLLGTHQGIHYPPDEISNDEYLAYEPNYTLTETVKHPELFSTPEYESVDYYAYITQLASTRFYQYLDSNYEILPEYDIYVTNEVCGLLAKLRMKLWFETSPLTMLYSYLIIKPKFMINSCFYWGEYMGKATEMLRMIPLWENYIALLAFVFIWCRKDKRSAFLFPLILYLGNILAYAIGFSFERYNASVVSAKYIAIGIGIGLAVDVIVQLVHSFSQKHPTGKYLK